MSLRFRINLAITVVIVLFTLATANVLLNDLKRSIREEIEAGTRITVQIMETVIASPRVATAAGQPNEALLGFLRHVGRVRANEIRFYDGQDRLLYESPPSVYKQGRWAPEWFAQLVRPQIGDFRLNFADGTVVITPDASRSILDAWDDIKHFVLLALSFYLLLNLSIFWLLGRWLRPLRSILGGLSEMEQGRFDARLPNYRLPEFSSISHTFNRMADALQESLAENQRLALVAHQSSDAIIIHDLEGRISFWNAAASRMFGHSAETIVGQSAMLIAPPERQGELRENLEAIKRRERIENLETLRLSNDGRRIDVSLSAAPLVDPVTDTVIGEICSMRDITEHKRMQAAERELEQNRHFTQLVQSRLEEERRAIARELHDELGQCVTAIKTIGTAIANRTEKSSPDTHANAKTIVSVASHIYDVVHGIIRQLRPSGLDHLGLSETIDDAVSGWRDRHPEIECEVVLGPDIDGFSEAANITVYRIVQECLTNIVRHSGADRATVKVTLEPVEPHGPCLVVSVRDNGKGLSQPNEQEAARFGLIGMRERVQGLGGSFEISGAAGEGVTVRAVVPAAPAGKAGPGNA
jgi:two-component system, NarL family, sensor histidine kinase UhpB